MWAIIFKPWEALPVYHRPTPRMKTLCGRMISRTTPWLPLKHVVKFARPCKGCYPA